MNENNNGIWVPGYHLPGNWVDGFYRPGAYVPGQWVPTGEYEEGRWVDTDRREPGQWVDTGQRTPGGYVDGEYIPGAPIYDWVPAEEGEDGAVADAPSRWDTIESERVEGINNDEQNQDRERWDSVRVTADNGREITLSITPTSEREGDDYIIMAVSNDDGSTSTFTLTPGTTHGGVTFDNGLARGTVTVALEDGSTITIRLQGQQFAGAQEQVYVPATWKKPEFTGEYEEGEYERVPVEGEPILEYREGDIIREYIPGAPILEYIPGYHLPGTWTDGFYVPGPWVNGYYIPASPSVEGDEEIILGDMEVPLAIFETEEEAEEETPESVAPDDIEKHPAVLAPEENEYYETIELGDAPVPLGAMPQTGYADFSGLLVSGFLLSGFAAAAVATAIKKRRNKQ